MTHGLVFGKFYPLHKGHMALIEFAQRNCDQLTVLVCASTTTETIPGIVRKNWLQASYQNQPNITISLLEYDENQLPNTSVSSRKVSEVWAKKLQQLLPEINMIFTSEPYGEYLAEFMNIPHMLFDSQRIRVPISAREIRQAPLRYWSYLPSEVQPYFVKKIVILGTESTGKTILTENLAKHYCTTHAEEIGRTLIPKSSECSLSDLYAVAEAHAEEIDRKSLKATKLLFIDTDIHITQSYADFLFGKHLKVCEKILCSNKADLYLYLNANIPYIQDGTRLELPERNALDHSHQKTLKEANIRYHTLSGDWEDRYEQAIMLINALIEKFS